MSSEKFECEYCKKEYTNISNLKHHQKTAKFCLDIQNQLPKSFKCELCNKVFDNNKYLKQHIDHYCKTNKIQKENEIFKNEINLLKTEITELKAKLDQKDKDLKNELKNELKIKLQCKDDIIKLKDNLISKLEKENAEYKKLVTRPTTIYNHTDNSTTNNTTNTNYQIQFNQLLEKIEALNTQNIAKRLNDINMVEFTDNCIKNFESTLTTSLSNVFKNFTFCTDKARRTVVIKNEEGKTEKMSIDDFINMGLKLGVTDIINLLKETEAINDCKITDDNKEVYNVYDEKLQDAKDYLIASKKQDQVYLSKNKHPLPSLAKTTLSSCDHLSKK
jgi:hypothetical protein